MHTRQTESSHLENIVVALYSAWVQVHLYLLLKKSLFGVQKILIKESAEESLTFAATALCAGMLHTSSARYYHSLEEMIVNEHAPL